MDRTPYTPETVLDLVVDPEDPTIQYITDLYDASNKFDYLQTDWAAALAPINPKTQKPLNEYNYRVLIAQLTCKRAVKPKAPLLGRFKFHGQNIYEPYKYFLETEGYNLARNKKLTYYKAKSHTLEVLHQNLNAASLVLGVSADPNYFLLWPRDILNRKDKDGKSKMGAYDPKSPFSFPLPDGRRWIPDFKPIVLGRHDPYDTLLLLSEDDRHTEGTRNHKDPAADTRRLEEKFEKIVIAFKAGLVTKKYGHKKPLLLFKTTNHTHAKNVRDFLFERFGALDFVLIKAIPEFAEIRGTVPITTAVWDTPWIRPGCPDYSLQTFGAIS